MSTPSADSGASDVIVAGAGAAGLATAIFARRANRRSPSAARRRAQTWREDPRQRRDALQRHQRIGHRARLLGRTPDDRPPRPARVPGGRHGRVLPRHRRRRCTKKPTASCFPTRNRARDVLDALLARSRGAWRDVARRSPRARRRGDDGLFIVETDRRRLHAPGPSCSPPAAARCPRPAATARGLRHRASASATPSCPRRRRSCRSCSTISTSIHRELSGVSQDVELAVLDRRRRGDAADGRAAVDALRRQRSGRAERVAPLASRAARGAGRAHDRSTSAPAQRSTTSTRGCSDSRAIAAKATAQSSLCRFVPASVAAAMLRTARDRRPRRCSPTWRATIVGVCARARRMAAAGRRHARLQLRRSHRRRRGARRNRSRDDGVAGVSGTVSGRRNARRGRPYRRLQLPVGVVVSGFVAGRALARLD